jgi:2-amino-4-hydroxy-6-hydroxymethyldihydropteridine diphosphokinase
MDLDLLLFGEIVGEFEGAILPRPDLLRRAFMLGPLADLAPSLQHPTEEQTIGALWEQFDRGAHDLRPVTIKGAEGP